ncbi:MAG TPA: pyridoxamine 5'-phosphate oxidase [Pyrinomonadaceae bacterium]|nr:pyridoxamine 5'-phosphate oxidase [Pyrinomonadaceae bacterium]
MMEGLDENEIDRDPIRQFQVWFDDAIAAKLPMPDAMSLATVTPDCRPTSRMVLLKQVDGYGFVFFTNYESAKAKQLEVNPYAALVFYWPQLERQVRVEGKVTKTAAEESAAYFKTRPRESQIGAWASPQSEVIAARDVLEQRARELAELYCDRDVDCPAHWGGFRLTPDRIEFWKGRVGRLHDRILYELQPDDSWTIKRLAP